MLPAIVFQCPDWTPLRVCQAAELMVGLAPMSVIVRFLADPRMEGVWRELDKRKRVDYQKSEQPVYGVTLPEMSKSWTATATAIRTHAIRERRLGRDERAGQLEAIVGGINRLDMVRRSREFVPPPGMEIDCAKVVLFVTAVARYCDDRATVTRKEFDALVADAQANGRHDVAAALEELRKDKFQCRLIVERRRTDASLEAFVEALTQTCRELFGHELPGLVAILTNVGFERDDMSRYKVRAITRTKPGLAA